MGDYDDIEELKQLEASGGDVPAQSVPAVSGPDMEDGSHMVTGFIPMRALFGRFTVPYYNPITKKGYQRAPSKARISQFANKLRSSRIDMPNSVLFNIRDTSAREYFKNGFLHLPEIKDNNNSDLKMHIVDGQHRILALKKAIFDGWEEGADFLVPFICILGAEEPQEMKQFYEINSNAKSVRTDLALALLKQMTIEDPSMIEDLEGKKKAWLIEAQTIVERLANESPLWRGRIRLPMMEKGATTMPSASMVKSLQPVLTSAFFRRLSEDQRLRILEAYWEGVRQLIPAAFDTPDDYTLLKGVGVRVLHNLLPVVVEAIRDAGKSTAVSDNYSDVLEDPLTQIHAINAYGVEVVGTEFWLSGADGGAGSYSSESGIARLTAALLKMLPESDM